MKTIVSIDGKIVHRRRAVISVFDNALLYAEGLFETCLAVHGKLLFGSYHLRRLNEGAKVIGLRLPVKGQTLLGWMEEVAAQHGAHVTKVRVTITAGETARWSGADGPPRVVIMASNHTIPTEPFLLYCAPFRVESGSLFRRIKTISYATQATALKLAQKAGCDDALLLNDREQVAEVTSANIFWVQKGKLYTPPISAGCLDGITRKVVIAEARRAALWGGERNSTLEALIARDEVFISSSLKLVVGVRGIKIGRRTHLCRHGTLTRFFRARLESAINRLS